MLFSACGSMIYHEAEVLGRWADCCGDLSVWHWRGCCWRLPWWYRRRARRKAAGAAAGARDERKRDRARRAGTNRGLPDPETGAAARCVFPAWFFPALGFVPRDGLSGILAGAAEFRPMHEARKAQRIPPADRETANASAGFEGKLCDLRRLPTMIAGGAA
jgi:hypothetical protein